MEGVGLHSLSGGKYDDCTCGGFRTCRGWVSEGGDEGIGEGLKTKVIGYGL